MDLGKIRAAKSYHQSQPLQVLGCVDFFGSEPAKTDRAATKLTPQLENLMTAAHLAPEWKNYRLDGVQITFVDGDYQPTLLGNSIIEGENAGVPLKGIVLHKLPRCIFGQKRWHRRY